MASSRVKTLPGCGVAVCAGIGCAGAGLSAAGLSTGMSIDNITANENGFSCVNPFTPKIIVFPPKNSNKLIISLNAKQNWHSGRVNAKSMLSSAPKGGIENLLAWKALRKQCENSERSAAASFDLHRNRENRRAFSWNPLQCSDVFKDRDSGCAENLMGQKIARGTVIDTRRVDA